MVKTLSSGGWPSILHFTTGDSPGVDYGDRIPELWYHGGTNQFGVSSAISGDGAKYKYSPFTPPLNIWITVEISQLLTDTGEVGGGLKMCS